MSPPNMANHVGQTMTGSASPVVISRASPGASRRNSLKHQDAAQSGPLAQLAHPSPPTRNASTALVTPVSPATPAAAGVAGAAPQGQHHGAMATKYPAAQTVSTQMSSWTRPQSHRAPINGFVSPSMQPLQAQSPPVQMAHFPSPRAGTTQHNTSAQYVALVQLIKRTEPQVVRQVIRDCHETCLLGSEYHSAFAINTAIHKAQPSTLTRAITEFGSRLVQTSKHQLISHFTADDLDEIVDEILSKASNRFLDRALAQRLETIRARLLVNALAKAERLGYNVKDVVAEKKDGTEYVIPYMTQELAHHPSQHEQQPGVQPSAQLSVQPVHTESLPTMPTSTSLQPQTMKILEDEHLDSALSRCGVCARPVSGPDALKFHATKQICHGELQTIDRVGKDVCPHCGSTFASNSGLVYHSKLQVCGKYTDKDACAIKPALEKFYEKYAAARASGSTHKPKSRPSSTPVKSPAQSAKHPPEGGVHFKAVNSGTAATTTTASPAGKFPDPYAHLSPEDKQRLEAELAHTESHYGALLRKAMQLPQPAQDAEVAKVRNCLNTKQSTTRKKYGVKLRERRSRAEIEAERTRLLTALAKEDFTRREEAPASQDRAAPVTKKARIDEKGDSAPTAQSVNSGPADSPRRRVPLAEMGGLFASAATAEQTDPTTVKQCHSPPQAPVVNGSAHVAEATLDAMAKGTRSEPMELDEDSTESEDSDSEEEDGDIPAILTKN